METMRILELGMGWIWKSVEAASRPRANGQEPRAGYCSLLRQPKLPEKASMSSHMGFTASRSPGKERLIYNGAGQDKSRHDGARDIAGNGVRSRRPKELSQNYKKSDQNQGQNQRDQGQNQKDTGQGRPFIVAEQARTDNEPATKPHPNERAASKGQIDTSKKSNRIRNDRSRSD